MKKFTVFFVALLTGIVMHSQDLHRPKFHFTPAAHWMNDPNGMYFNNGTWHLFYQYYPGATKWGPMHWGHATSTDLLSWKEQPVALYPDSLGYIFSGSAVVDRNNTSGFGKNGKVPVVAIFTHHDPKGEKDKRNDYQTQSIAYSLDDGKTWTKYKGNPVLKNPGIVDFRDPKVSWNKKTSRWIMTLATRDRITFYSSPNLREWTKLSEFGENIGAHGGVWECPDLFPLKYKGRERWVLLVSINPGGPNGGSATQYFIGDFDGSTFMPEDTSTRFMDYGTDNYAGVTVANTGDRKVLIGWMSNWQYAELVPTVKWRSAMTLPRDLSLKEAGGRLYLASTPSPETEKLRKPSQKVSITDKSITASPQNAIRSLGSGDSLVQVDFNIGAGDFQLALSGAGGLVTIGFEKASNRFYIDRTQAGNTGFEKGFARRHWAPRVSTGSRIDVRVIVDVSSVEFFADGGLTTMTDIFFPIRAYNSVQLTAEDRAPLLNVRYTALKQTMPAR